MTAIIRMLFEITQIISEKIEYFLDITNILEWALYVFTILFVYNFDNQDELPEVIIIIVTGITHL